MAIQQIPAKFFYTSTGNPAWHGLGNVIPDNISGDLDKVLEFTGLDYDILKINKVNHFTGKTIPGEYELYNGNTHVYYGTCKSGYTPVNNKKALSFIHELMKDNNIVIDSIAEWPNGYVAVNYKLFETEVVRGDEHIAYLQAFFGHDGLKALNYFQSHTRMVCKNTVYKAMNTAEKAGHILKMKHTKNVETRMVDSIGLIEAMRDEAMSFVDRLRLIANKTLTADQVRHVLNSIYGDPKVLKSGETKDNARTIVENLFELNDGSNGISIIRGTGYNLLNAITQYNTHDTRINVHGNYNPDDRSKIEAGKRILNQINSANKGDDVAKFFDIIATV